MLVKIIGCLVLLACPTVFGFGQRQAFDSSEDDADVSFGLEQLNSLYTSNGESIPADPKVVLTTKQVVAGTKTNLVVQVDKPDGAIEGEVELCDISIWSRPWLQDTQLSKPIVCGMPESIRHFIEAKYNRQSNNLMYAVAKDWVINKDGDSFVLNSVDLFTTNCTKQDAEPIANTDTLYKTCVIADNAIKMGTCSTYFDVNEAKTDFEATRSQC